MMRMARDIFGRLVRTDIVGRRIPTRQLRREVLAENRRKGRAAEDAFRMRAALAGYEVERTGRGSDFRVRKRDLLRGRVTSTGLVEVKSGHARLSMLQRRAKSRQSNYKVMWVHP